MNRNRRILVQNRPRSRVGDSLRRASTLVLGINAAWTEAGSSGVALLRSGNGGHRIVAVSPSYAGFVALAAGRTIEWERSAAGGAPDVVQLLEAAVSLGGAPIDVVAIDLPMARTKILGRRAADQAVSIRFSQAWAGSYSPSAAWPGELGRRIAQAFVAAGFPLATKSALPASAPALIEVYPLAALVQLMRVPKRPPYKIEKIRDYFPDAPLSEKLDRLLESWRDIFAALEGEISELGITLPERSNFPSKAMLKRYENALDAVISAWVGACFLGGAAEPLGDDDAAIWVPSARTG